jgi:hypothetical protein
VRLSPLKEKRYGSVLILLGYNFEAGD